MHKTITFREPIHTFHIDSNQHVSNIVYVQWMEIGRIKMLEAGDFPVHVASNAGFAPFLVETQITYKRPLHLGDVVEVEVWLSELTRLYAWLEFRFRRVDGEEREEVAQGRQKGLFVDVERGRPTRLTEEQRAPFLPYVADPEAD